MNLRNIFSFCFVPLFLVTYLYFFVGTASADLGRSARTTSVIGDSGEFTVETVLDFEKDKEGHTWGLETAILYTSARLPMVSYLFESTLWEWDRPKDDVYIDGLGDSELSIYFMPYSGNAIFPGIVIGAKAKIPTANNRNIGTGKLDYSALLIVGKEFEEEFGELDINLELEYAKYGQPAPSQEDISDIEMEDEEEPSELPVHSNQVKDQFIYTLSIDYGLTENLSVYIELFGHTKETESDKDTFTTGCGLEYDIELTDTMSILIEGGIDTDKLITSKIGFEWQF